MITLYGLKTCDACKRARAALEAEGRAVAFVDIRAEADLAAKAPQWLAALGAEALINRRSTTWKGLSDEMRSGAGTAAGATALLA
ncbi:MAG: ArsC/Spx/MgsR family protein, partial [Pseudomonadota bacterium]